jgi:hypothetical protein
MPTSPDQSNDRTPRDSGVRFDVTMPTKNRAAAIEMVTALDLDRLPDRDGDVHLLITLDEVGMLAESGYEVHLSAALHVAPLDPALVMDDKDSMAWLESQVEGIERQAGS